MPIYRAIFCCLCGFEGPVTYFSRGNTSASECPKCRAPATKLRAIESSDVDTTPKAPRYAYLPQC